MNRRIGIVFPAAAIIALALMTTGCGTKPAAAPRFPDGADTLQRGMTLATVQKSLGSPGVVRTMPHDAQFATEADFDRPPRYPDLNITVYLGAWGGRVDSVAGWSYRSVPPAAAGTQPSR